MTIDEAKDAIAQIVAAQLHGADFVAALGPAKVAAACNGIGPESWPEDWRKKLNSWLSTFRLACDVHDCDFAYNNDGSVALFDAANERLLKNCLILADLKYAWYNPLRYFARNRAHLIALACSTFGWSSWQDAYNHHPGSSPVSPNLCGSTPTQPTTPPAPPVLCGLTTTPTTTTPPRLCASALNKLSHPTTTT